MRPVGVPPRPPSTSLLLLLLLRVAPPSCSYRPPSGPGSRCHHLLRASLPPRPHVLAEVRLHVSPGLLRMRADGHGLSQATLS